MSPGKFSGVTNTGQYHINTFECSALVISSAPQVWPKKDTLALGGQRRHILLKKRQTEDAYLKRFQAQVHIR